MLKKTWASVISEQDATALQSACEAAMATLGYGEVESEQGALLIRVYQRARSGGVVLVEGSELATPFARVVASATGGTMHELSGAEEAVATRGHAGEFGY